MRPQRVCAEIRQDAICHNVRASREKVGPGVRIMAVVKTDAYGHGAVATAASLDRAGLADAFAVATVPEGVELREGGITKPILVLGHTFQDEYENALRNEITLTVFHEENAKELSDTAASLGVTGTVHLAVDTGMGRIGFQPDEAAVTEIRNICALPNLRVEGIFTHFACADHADKTSRDRQIRTFTGFLDRLAAEGMTFPIRHMANSATVMEGTEDYLDMVRLGITMYGLLPSDEVDPENLPLEPAMKLISHVSHVKAVGPGFPVSYGSTYVTERDTVLATVPVGYGDGYPRTLSNKGFVLIHGKRAPITGRVCMDQFMVDVTDISDVRQGDEIVLVGDQGEDRITVEELSDLCGRFNYEFTCDINRRVPRIQVGILEKE